MARNLNVKKNNRKSFSTNSLRIRKTCLSKQNPPSPLFGLEVSLDHFRAAFWLCVKTRLGAKPSIPVPGVSSCKSNSDSYERFYTKTRLETELQGNSEMAYRIHIFFSGRNLCYKLMLSVIKIKYVMSVNMSNECKHLHIVTSTCNERFLDHE